MGILKQLSIVVPAYNEADNVGPVVLAVNDALQGKVADDLEWVVVDDGSSDDTWAEISRLAEILPNVVPVRHQRNRGLGAAVWTGMGQATGEWCTWIPADGQYQAEAILAMAKAAQGTNLVLLCRGPDGRAAHRRLFSTVLHLFVRFWLGFDGTHYSGAYMGRKDLLNQIPAFGNTLMQNFAVPIVARRDGVDVVRAQSDILPRQSGESKTSNLPTVLKTLFDLVRLRWSLARR